MTTPQDSRDPSPFWLARWGYPHAVLVTSALFLNGWVLESLPHSAHVSAPPWPFNFYLLALLWAVLFVVAWQWRRTRIVQWLGGVQLSVVSLAFVGSLSLLAGLIPQNGEHWVTNITGSWPFAFVLSLMLVNLGLATLNRLFRFHISDWAFICNHAGFWIVVAAMALGSGDIEKLKLIVGEGETSSQAVLQNATPDTPPVQMPFAITLKEFKRDNYHPRLAFYDSTQRDAQMKVVASSLAVGAKYKVQNFELEVESVVESAERTAAGFQPSQQKSAEFALMAKVIDTATGKLVKRSWMAPGNSGLSPIAIHTPSGVFVLLDPQAKLYRSTIEIGKVGATPTPAVIEVNAPLTFSGWKIYQSSFEMSANREKFLSIFDLVRDPWLPVVYLGAFLMLIGTTSLFWNGMKQQYTTTQKDAVP